MVQQTERKKVIALFSLGWPQHSAQLSEHLGGLEFFSGFADAQHKNALNLIALSNGIHHVKPLNYPTKNTVLVAEPRRVFVRNEELRAVGGGPRVCHR